MSQPLRDRDKPFRMPIEEVLKVQGIKGVVVVGTIESGEIRPNDEVQIVGGASTVKATCSMVVFYKENEQVEAAYAGDRASLSLGGVNREDVRVGRVVTRGPR